jgi:transcription elongation factor Elf1
LQPGVCDICEKPLASMRTMKKHRLTHMSIENRSFECKVCFKFYVSEMALKVHQREHSDSGRSFICDICGLGYHSTSVLNVSVCKVIL